MKFFFLPLLSLVIQYSFFNPPSFAQQGEWTWMKGDIVPNSNGVFGTMGTASSDNTPPALYGAAMWVDGSNNIWLFGGAASYNTLWKYDIAANDWTWINGTSINSSPGVYGTMGIPSSSNTPGARGFGFLSWKDLNGDFWIYGGWGYDAFGNEGLLSDLWRYSMATNEWTWMQGSNSSLPGASPVYGTIQVPSATNTPGGREESTANWVDSAGNFWFFGGFDNNISQKDDVWKFDITLNQWVWMAGTTGTNLSAVHGTIGVSSPSNTPGGRNAYCAWKDLSGKFWLYGGSELTGQYTDLWRFDVTTLEWTWMSGSNVINTTEVAGTQCSSDTSFYPTSRSENRACWTDQCGNLWLFGGVAYSPGIGYHNDLWAYRPNENDWTYAGGTLNANGGGTYGTQGVSSPANLPGSRYGTPAVYDLSGNVWLMGGMLSAGNTGNDLWRFVPDTACPVSINCVALQFPSFAASNTNVCEKFCVDFTDQSNNNPVAWEWLFPGGSPSSSTEQNPTNICYDVPGVYDVTLITTNANGNDTLTLADFITVYPTPPIPAITQNGYTLTSSAAGSYQWQLNAVDIPGATDQSYEVLQTGFYTVIVSDSNGCVNSNTLYVEITGIENPEDDAVFVFPNPSEGKFTVKFREDATGMSSIRIINSLGIQVYFISQENKSPVTIEIDLGSYPAGLFFLEITTSKHRFLKKIEIQ